MRLAGLFIGFILIFQGAFCQELSSQDTFHNSLMIGAKAHSFGWGLDVQYIHKNGGKGLIFAWDFATVKDRREIKRASVYKDQGGKDFVFDKINSLYTTSFTVGPMITLLPKNDFSKMVFRGSISAGPVLGILKPYYLELFVPSTVNPNTGYAELGIYDHNTVVITDIIGAASYFNGFSDLTFKPGAEIRAQGILDFATSSSFVRALTVAFQVQGFGSGIPILDKQEDKQLYISGQIGFLIGNAW